MKIMLRRYIILVVCIAISFTSIISCSSGSGLQVTGLQLTAREFTGDLNMTRSMAAVTGMAKNVTNLPRRNCTIIVAFFDAQHNNLGSATSLLEVINPGETWNFTVQLTSPDAWKARSYDIKINSQ